MESIEGNFRKLSAKGSIRRPNRIHREGRNFILAIGIDQYRYLPRLSNAVRDAKEVITVLTQRYQFEDVHVRTLFDQQATERNIRREFDKLVDELNSSDNLIIYFSGHGLYHEKRKRGYWIPVDAEYGQTADYLDNSIIRDYIQDIPSHHTFLVSDACYSGSFFRQSRAIHTQKVDSAIHYQKIYREPSRWALTSGGIEEVLDGKEGENSPFNQSFIHCLKYNDDAQLSVLELIMRVQKAVGNNAKQQPIGNRIYGVNDFGMGQFVFRLKGASTPSIEKIQVEAPTIPVRNIQKQNKLSLNQHSQAKELITKVIRVLKSEHEQSATVSLGKLLHPSLKISSPTANRFWQYDFLMSLQNASQYSLPLTWGEIRQSNKKMLRYKGKVDKGEEWIYTINKRKGASGMPGFVRIFFSVNDPKMSVSGMNI